MIEQTSDGDPVRALETRPNSTAAALSEISLVTSESDQLQAGRGQL
jgi:hypothetical protein